MAKISVVMCCYNSERYIKETIDSVLGQTFKDFEFIIWNDGSTDSTEQIIMSYNDKRIKYFKDSNKGEGMAAQFACRHASAKYIARIDSDDVWLPEKLALQYDYMESHQNTVLLSCPVIFIDADSRELGLSFPVTNTSYLKKSIAKVNLFPHSGSMYRTSIYNKVGGYNDVRLFQDYLLFWKMSDFGDLALLPVPLIKYRLLSGSVAHRFENSSYKYIICAFKDKIFKEKGANETDLKLCNSVYEQIKVSNDEIFEYRQDLQTKLYNLLRKFVDDAFAYKIMIHLKNFLAMLYYR